MLHIFDFIRFECKPNWKKKGCNLCLRDGWLLTTLLQKSQLSDKGFLLDRKHCPLEILKKMLSGFFLSELYTVYGLSVSSEALGSVPHLLISLPQIRFLSKPVRSPTSGQYKEIWFNSLHCTRKLYVYNVHWTECLAKWAVSPIFPLSTVAEWRKLLAKSQKEHLKDLRSCPVEEVLFTKASRRKSGEGK